MSSYSLRFAIILIFLCGIFNVPLSALTFLTVTKNCPLCETRFRTELAASGTQFGMRLDLKPLGLVAAPQPVPVCPNCHFVLYRTEFQESDLDVFKGYVQSEEYRTWAKDRSPYFLLARLLEKKGEDDFNIAYAFLKASWEEESKPKFLREDLELSLGYLDKYLKNVEGNAKKELKTDENHLTAELLKGEFLRRLGRFKDASGHFESLSKQKRFKEREELVSIIKTQLKLCRDKNADPR